MIFITAAVDIAWEEHLSAQYLGVWLDFIGTSRSIDHTTSAHKAGDRLLVMIAFAVEGERPNVDLQKSGYPHTSTLWGLWTVALDLSGESLH